MSIIAELADGTQCAVPAPPATNVNDLIAAVQDALALDLPVDAYDMVVRGAGGEETVLGDCGEQTVEGVGIHGCEERVEVRVRYAYVAREQLQREGVVTAADADGVVKRICEGADLVQDEGERDEMWKRMQLIMAAEYVTPVQCLKGAVEANTQWLASRMLDVHPDAVRGTHLLQVAVARRSVGMAALLLERGASTRGSLRRPSPLSFAARLGDLELVQLLLDHGAAVDEGERNGRTPLARAARFGHIAVVEALLARGADVNARDVSGQSVLAVAAGGGDPDVVEVLCGAGARVNDREHDGRTALSCASAVGEDAVVRRLLELGAEVDLADAEARTPLSHAAEIGFTDVAAALLEYGACVNVRDHTHQTPLGWAAMAGNNDLYELLLARPREQVEERS